MPPDFLFRLAERLPIVPYATVAERETSLIELNNPVTIRTSDMTSCQFHDFPVIFAGNDKATLGFMFIPCLMGSPKPTRDAVNWPFGDEGGFHRAKYLSSTLYI